MVKRLFSIGQYQIDYGSLNVSINITMKYILKTRDDVYV